MALLKPCPLSLSHWLWVMPSNWLEIQLPLSLHESLSKKEVLLPSKKWLETPVIPFNFQLIYSQHFNCLQMHFLCPIMLPFGCCGEAEYKFASRRKNGSGHQGGSLRHYVQREGEQAGFCSSLGLDISGSEAELKKPSLRFPPLIAHKSSLWNPVSNLLFFPCLEEKKQCITITCNFKIIILKEKQVKKNPYFNPSKALSVIFFPHWVFIGFIYLADVFSLSGWVER